METAPLIRVLVIDDDEDNREMMKSALEMYGVFEVHTSVDGMTGLKTAYEQFPDVILLDLMMPNYDGAFFMEWYDGKAPVVVLTGWHPVPALPRQPYAVIIKPKSTDRIASILLSAAQENVH